MTNICYSQKDLEVIANYHKFTHDTKLFDGMTIYTIINAKQEGAFIKKGYNLICTDTLVIPSDEDWEEWGKYPVNDGKSRFDINQDDYWTVIDTDTLERSVMSAEDIYERELEIPSKKWATEETVTFS